MRKLAIGAVLATGILATGAASAADFRLTSPDLAEGGTINSEQVYKGFGCTGDDVSPALAWSGAPAGTKSFAVTLYDPDAPTGSGWWHWVIFDIPPTASGLAKDAGNAGGHVAPGGSVQSRTDFGTPGYGGPCPPKGDKPHHYTFTVYALDLGKLPAKQDSSAAFVGFNVHFHTLGKASLTGLYGR